MRKPLFILSTIVLASPLAAQDQVTVADRSPDETTITVTATGTRSNLADTGQPVTVIGQAEIDSVQGADVARILERAPGVTTTRNGPPGAFTGVRVRGAGAEQLLVLVDGVRVADAAAPSGGFDFGTLAAGEIEKLDLERGSNSTIWGSDAIGGVLLVTTRAARGLAASAEYGGENSSYLTASGGAGSDRFFVGGSAGWQRTDGYSAAASGSEPDGYDAWSANGQARAYLSNRLEVFVQGRYADGRIDLDGYPPPLYAFGDTAEYQKTRQYTAAGGARWDTALLHVTATYSIADTVRRSFDPAAGAAPTYVTDGYSQRADLRGAWRPLGPLVLDLGANGEWTRFDTSFDARQHTGIWGAYAQVGIETPRLSAHLGLRHDDHRRFGGATSIGADLSYALGGDVRLRASYGEGFKAPTLFQLLSDYGNAALRPERSRSYDLGLAWHSRSDPTWGAVTVFRRDSSDLIDFVSCYGSATVICTGRPYGTYDNVSQARAEGYEVEFGLAPTTNLRTQVVYSYVKAVDLNAGTDLARRPRHALTASVDWTSPLTLVVGGDLRLVGDSFDDAGNTVRIDGYAVADVRASFPLTAKVELFGRVENLFDARYTEIAGYGTLPRTAFVGARFRL